MIHIETKLFYGFPLSKDDPTFNIEEYEQLAEYVQNRYGFPKPKERRTKAWYEWFDSALDLSPPCDIGEYNHIYSPKLFVFVSDSYSMQYHDNLETLEPVQTMTIKPEWDEQLQDYCKVMGITYRQPNVYIVTYWS